MCDFKANGNIDKIFAPTAKLTHIINIVVRTAPSRICIMLIKSKFPVVEY